MKGSSQKYTYEQLLKKPPNVDTSKLEAFLLSEEFPSVFGITEEEFDKLPQWKQVGLKKSANLF